MKKKILINTITKPKDKQLLPGIVNGSLWNCDVMQTMLLVGILTSPPRYSGFHLSNFWAWLRYASAISPLAADLRLRSEWSEIDPHQKTVLADDFGMGFTCHYLMDQHGFDDFADTRFLLEHVFGSGSGVVSGAKNGQYKTPDFIAVDASGNLHILECKGTQSSVGVVRRAMTKGIDQKQNVKGYQHYASCMVGGLYVPLHKAKAKAQLFFEDPEVDPRLVQLAQLGHNVVAREVRRQSFAKVLVAAGLWRSANALESGVVDSVDLDFVRRTTNRGELDFLEYRKDDTSGMWTKLVEYRSFEPRSTADVKAGYQRAVRTTLKIELPDDVVKLFADAVSSNGQVSLRTVDHWLAVRRRNRRAADERSIEIVDPQTKSPVETKRRVRTAWRGEEISEDSSVLDTSSGIRLTLAREAY